MFFISRELNGKYGIVDTKDWVEEFYTEGEIAKFKTMGVSVKNNRSQLDYLKFVWSYWAVASECGSSGMDLVVDYILDNVGLNYLDAGSSLKEIIKDLKSEYLILKSKDIIVEVRNLGSSSFYNIVSRCLEADRWNKDTTKYISILEKDYHLNPVFIKKAFYLS